MSQVRVPDPRSSPAARFRAPQATRHQPDPPRPPFPPPSAPSPFSASRPRLPPPLSPSPAPGARAPAVTPRPLPAEPGRGQHPPPADRPRRPPAAPAGKRSPCRSRAGLAGICSFTLLAGVPKESSFDFKSLSPFSLFRFSFSSLSVVSRGRTYYIMTSCERTNTKLLFQEGEKDRGSQAVLSGLCEGGHSQDCQQQTSTERLLTILLNNNNNCCSIDYYHFRTS